MLEQEESGISRDRSPVAPYGFAPASGGEADPDPGSRTTDPQWVVGILDERDERAQAISGLLARQHLRARRIGRAEKPEAIAGVCPVVLAALDGGLELVSQLRNAGSRTIAYGDGTGSWTVGRRCEPLLAGAIDLLDSRSADFLPALALVLQRVFDSMRAQQTANERGRKSMASLGFAGESKEILAVFEWVNRISLLSDLPVLIAGEPGTGKELLARAVHQLDPKRCRGPFVPVNCGAISTTLAESELFGHRKGAFTGADRDRPGLIRSAQGGVLFLDEVGEMNIDLQTKLLRVLQEGRVLCVGDDREIPVDVRIIAATNRDLDEMVRQKRFRPDLLHRLNVLSVRIAPLRERPADVKPLIEHFLAKHRDLPAARVTSVSKEFIDALAQLPLHGNARELENVIRRVLISKANDDPLALGDLPIEIWRQLRGTAGTAGPETELARAGASAQSVDLLAHLAQLLASRGWSLADTLDHCERLILAAAMQRTRGNQSQTARLLGITPRSVYNKLKKYQLETI